MGAQIKSIPYPSPQSRVRLGALGPVQVEPAFSNSFVLAAHREELKKSATAMINAWRSGTLIVVTHGANIQALSGHFLAPGEMIVLTPGSMTVRVFGRIPPPN